MDSGKFSACLYRIINQTGMTQRSVIPEKRLLFGSLAVLITDKV
jgi:hypothetical protein